MSLSSFLLPGSGKGKAVDQGLDELFRSATTAPSTTANASSSPISAINASLHEKKRKATDTPIVKLKRAKSEAASVPSASTPAQPKRLVLPEDETGSVDLASDDEEEAEEDDTSDGSSDSDAEGDPSTLVHESLLESGAKTRVASNHDKPKHAPAEETSGQRDARTLFIGNVAVEVTKSRPMQKQLKRHILSFVPSAKIESVRFRSVAFKNPTSELPKDGDDKLKSKAKSKPRVHDRTRAASWRNENQDEDEAKVAPPKQFLTPKEKKRIAFIKHDIHEQVDAVNAYIVFAHPPSAEALAKRPANVPPPVPVMDPYEAATVCAAKADESTFSGRTLRVDVVGKGIQPRAGGSDGGAGPVNGELAGDPKATVFVGNLDFASKEEDLRTFFETLMREERGEPGSKTQRHGDSDDSESEEDGEDKDEKVGGQRSWVKRVRIVRDRDTQLGKGFAYVQFVDRECVDEILTFEQSKLKFAKRKLRVQRCKTLPGGPKLRASRSVRPSTSSTPPTNNGKGGPSRPPPPPRLVPASRHVPKGNPELGAKLVHLPKEERKKVKAADADRVARRMAKKRAKTLAEKGVKSQGDRERVRKRASEKGGSKEGAKPQRRVRSGRAISKLNTKK